MSEPASTAPVGSDNPQEKRTCRDCGEEKTVTPETWPYRNRGKGTPYQAHGARCKICEAARKKQYDERKDQVAALVAEEPPAKELSKEPAKDKRKDEVEQAKLDAAKSLKLGSRVLNQQAAGVLARIIGWAEDEHDENHRWAVQFLAERILPRKLYEELGNQAAGVGQLADRAPVFRIEVSQALPEPKGQTYDGQAAVTVEALPSLPHPQ